MDAKEWMKANGRYLLSSNKEYSPTLKDMVDYANYKIKNAFQFVVGQGYLCSIEGKNIFVIARNIADCREQLKIISNGKHYQIENTVSVDVCHCP